LIHYWQSRYQLFLKKKIDEKIIKKFERRLFEKHGMSIKQSIEHFQKFDGILKEFVGSEAEDLEKKCMQKVSTFKKSKRKNCYLITINDSSLAEFMLNCWGDDKTRRILNVVLDKPLTIAQILTACGLTRTSGYREIKSLVINGMLVKYDMIISEGKKVPKYKMVFDSVTIKIDKEGTSKTSSKKYCLSKFFRSFGSLCQAGYQKWQKVTL